MKALAGLVLLACTMDPCLPVREATTEYCNDQPGKVIEINSPVCKLDTLCPGVKPVKPDTCQPMPQCVDPKPTDPPKKKGKV